MIEIKQRDLSDCGSCCISYLIQYYKGYVPLESIRDDTHTNINGTTAYDIVNTLRNYHFDAYGMKSTYDNLKTSPLPCIIHVVLPNGYHHFILITSFKKDKVNIYDPEKGKYSLTKEELLKIWDNIIIIAIPLSKIPILPKEKNIFSILFHYLKSEYKLIIFLLLINIILSLMTVLGSFYLKIGLQDIHVLEWRDYIHFLAIPFGIFYVLKYLLDYLKELLKTYISKNIEITFLSSFIKHILHIPINKIETYTTGETITRIEEAEQIKSLLVDIAVTLLLELCLSMVSLIILYQLNQSLFKILIFGMLIYLGIGIISSHYIYHIVLEEIQNEKEWKDTLLEQIHLIPTMKHLNQTEYASHLFLSSLCKRVRIHLSHQKVISFIEPFKNSFLEILFFLLATYGLYLIQKGELTLIDFITFQSLYAYLIQPLKEMIDIIPKYNYLKGIFSKISEYIHIPEESLQDSPNKITNYAITINHLTYSYPYQKNVLDDLSMSIDSMSHVFIKGASGRGKSTLCKILMKDLTAYEGNILIGDWNIKDYSLKEIRSQICYLSQNEFILHASIKENILLGRDISSNDFLAICKICHIDEIVDGKLLRYDSTVNDQTLSGGEKERIILARTLLSKAHIFLLDECLSEVDEELERDIIKNMHSYLKDKTVIYISHRNCYDLFKKVVSFENV